MKFYYFVHALSKIVPEEGHCLFRSTNPAGPSPREFYLHPDGSWGSFFGSRVVRVKTFREGVQRIKQVEGKKTIVRKYGF